MEVDWAKVPDTCFSWSSLQREFSWIRPTEKCHELLGQQYLTVVLIGAPRYQLTEQWLSTPMSYKNFLFSDISTKISTSVFNVHACYLYFISCQSSTERPLLCKSSGGPNRILSIVCFLPRGLPHGNPLSPFLAFSSVTIHTNTT